MGEILGGILRFILEVLVPLSIGAVVGYTICALMTMSSHSEMQAELDRWRNEAIKWQTAAELKELEFHAAIGRRT